MPKIYRYKPITISDGIVNVQLPYDGQGAGGHILTQIDEYAYFTLYDGYELPTQREELTIEEVILTPKLAADISNNSVAIQSINIAVRNKIAEKYSISDEIKLLRTAPSAEFDEYNTYAEECRNWGRAEKAKFGL